MWIFSAPHDIMDAFKFFPLEKCYKSQIGSINARETLTFKIHCRADIFLSGIRLCLIFDGREGKQKLDMRGEYGGEYNIYSCEFCPAESGLYWYYFECRQYEHRFYISSAANLHPISDDKLHKLWQLTVTDEYNKNLDWFAGGVMYHIFVDRFAIGGKRLIKQGVKFHDNLSDCPDFLPVSGKILNNDFFGGNLLGIENKLDYIRDLGVNIIYLSPIFKAASNHRYDTGDYSEIDELLGTTVDLERLIKKAESYNMRLIIDGVFNHIGDDSKYFNKYNRYNSIGAYQSEDSVYRDWFRFSEYPNRYDSWWGIDTLPSVNQDNKSFRQYIAGEDGILANWLSLGISGVRLDVVDEIGDTFLDEICERVNEECPSNIIIGEVWEDASNKTAYGKRRRYFRSKQLDSVMNYPLKDAIINFVKTGSGNLLIATVDELQNNYPARVLNVLMNILGTHDTFRILTALGDNADWRLSRQEKSEAQLTGDALDIAIKRLKLAALLQFTMFGVPCIYYGDEAGMQGYEDPFNRRFFPWDNINQELHEWYKFLGALRQSSNVFKYGEFKFIYRGDRGVIYARGEMNEFVVAVNMGAELQYHLIDRYKNLLSGETVQNINLSCGEYMILRKE